jgi:hypothetical protein
MGPSIAATSRSHRFVDCKSELEECIFSSLRGIGGLSLGS